MSNLTPISLVSEDTKIGSKAIARRLQDKKRRLQDVIPDVVHPNQNASVAGKSIHLLMQLGLSIKVDKGGLKTPHLESIIKSQRILCCRKFAENQEVVAGRISFPITSKNEGPKLV